MLPYILLALAVPAVGIPLCEIKKSRRNDIIFLCIASFGLILFSSLRGDSVGVDYTPYANYFNKVGTEGWAYLISPKNGYRFEFGFCLLNYLVSRFTLDPRIYMLVISMIAILLTSLLLYRHCSIPWLGMYVFVSFGFFSNSLNFLRQAIAIAIYLFAIEFIKKKQFLPYLLLVIAAFSFHKVMLVMIPVYFIAHIPVNWKSLVVYLGLMALVLAFSWQLFDFVTQFVFQNYRSETGLYYMNGRDWNTALIPAIVGVLAVLMHRFLLRRDPGNIVLINFSIYSGILYLMTCKHFLFQRFGMIFFTSAILLIPEIVKCAELSPEKKQELEASLHTDKKKKHGKKESNFEQRKLRQELTMRKYYYFDGIGAVLVVGFLYVLGSLYANRVLLVPYVTFFS